MAEEEKAPEQGGEKKSKAILFVVIGIVVVLLILVGLVVMLLLSGGHDEEEGHKEAAPTHQEAAPAQATQQAPKIIVGNTVSVRNPDKFSPGLIYPAEGPIPFTVNLMTQTGKRYLKTSLQFELDKDELKATATQAEMNKKLPMIKDVIIDVLSSKSLEDVATTKGKNRVKDEIVKRINEFMIDGKVFDVFFVDFVVS